MSLCLCYLKIMLGKMPENFRGEKQHSVSQISSKKEKELKNDLSQSDSIISVSTSASNAINKCGGARDLWRSSGLNPH